MTTAMGPFCAAKRAFPWHGACYLGEQSSFPGGRHMTSIIANAYVLPYANNRTYSDIQAQPQPQKAGQPSHGFSDSAISVTLSEAGRAALARGGQSADDDETDKLRQKMTELLDGLGRTSPLTDGKLAVDLSGFARAEVFAIAQNTGNKFTADEQKAAKSELQQRFDAALAGAHSLLEVTGSYRDLYEASLEYLDAASAEEKKSAEWQQHYAAVSQALGQLNSNPGQPPQGIKSDPVVAYLGRVAKGEQVKDRTFADVSDDARAGLDNIYAKAGDLKDLSKFGSRALSAIVLNRTDTFTSTEIAAARSEMKSRLGQSVQSAFQSAGSTGDPTAFSKKLIAQYGSMSVEEREAAGLDDKYYNTIVKNYETSLNITKMFGGTGSGGSNLLSFL